MLNEITKLRLVKLDIMEDFGAESDSPYSFVNVLLYYLLV